MRSCGRDPNPIRLMSLKEEKEISEPSSSLYRRKAIWVERVEQGCIILEREGKVKTTIIHHRGWREHPLLFCVLENFVNNEMIFFLSVCWCLSIKTSGPSVFFIRGIWTINSISLVVVYIFRFYLFLKFFR